MDFTSVFKYRIGGYWKTQPDSSWSVQQWNKKQQTQVGEQETLVRCQGKRHYYEDMQALAKQVAQRMGNCHSEKQ